MVAVEEVVSEEINKIFINFGSPGKSPGFFCARKLQISLKNSFPNPLSAVAKRACQYPPVSRTASAESGQNNGGPVRLQGIVNFCHKR